jgi:hypothetical protein
VLPLQGWPAGAGARSDGGDADARGDASAGAAGEMHAGGDMNAGAATRDRAAPGVAGNYVLTKRPAARASASGGNIERRHMMNLRGQPEVTLSSPHPQVAAAGTPGNRAKGRIHRAKGPIPPQREPATTRSPLGAERMPPVLVTIGPDAANSF